MALNYFVDPDIRKASTLPASFYRDPVVFETLREKVFRRSWQFIDPRYLPAEDEKAVPFNLLEGFIKDPLLLSRENDSSLHCLSNVCTHRANLLLSKRSTARKLVCGYHGRRFSLAGRFEFMPEFDQAENFPSECDHLPGFPLVHYGPLWFTSLNAALDFRPLMAEMDARIGYLPLHEFKFAPERSKNYDVNAHWALYCDNYLEGFHIPFVHKDLDAVLDYGSYDTHLFPFGCLQTGYASSDTEAIFDLPDGHIDFGKRIAAYYFWVFPNLMFNFYPWGLSLNVVIPVTKERTHVQFISYVCDASRLGEGAGSGLDKVELEDEEVVEGVQQGLQSGVYTSGRFSPTRERGVHHFHRMLAEAVNAW